MRLRNIPYAKDVLAASSDVIKNETIYHGKWSKEVFGNDHPLHIEIGMGKGKFIIENAKKYKKSNKIIEIVNGVCYTYSVVASR